ncbi:pesticin C-terminus-like muramidase [Myxococcus xanthus]|uniref:pesticin C-terminus-like muramidase n=1 Tax=Myxococcus xanthus TaxID=34 RepID=UPI0002D3891B|nr:pesticin C-terminus-like muramidase [Myxococcus xanthus]UYI12521.1 pesticin C-terminus-like muramidase [Myxococcus xanthus]UYI19889.1 pesticin C-terminus-like muramidase [Myxococcus xanthus]
MSGGDAARGLRNETNRREDARQPEQNKAKGYSVKDGWDSRPAHAAKQSQPAVEAQAVAAEDGVAAATEPDVDWDFIAEQEGRAVQDGYVPDATGSKSGVTVGTGVDLGARDMNDLDRLGLSDALKTKLEPYLGKQGQDAADFLAENPLNLTAEEVKELDRAVKGEALDNVVKEYNTEVERLNAADGGSRPKFAELPREMQTVIASVGFQYGSLKTATPNFFAQVTEQRWDDAKANLEDFGDRYPSRRGREADLLGEGIATLS